MKLIAFLLLIPAIAAYSISQLAQHGKLKSKDIRGFWGQWSSDRKYDLWKRSGIMIDKVQAPKNWYYRFFKIKYKERFPLSATALVFLTDGYHMCQFLMFLFLSLSITFAIGFDWYLLAGVWTGIHFVHAGFYKLLQR